MPHRKPSDPPPPTCFSQNISLFIGLQNCLQSIPTQKPLKQIKNDIFWFVQKIGLQGQKYVLTYLMQSTQLLQLKDKPTLPYRASLLTQIIKQYSLYNYFMSYFPQIIIKVCKDNKINNFVNCLMNYLKLPLNTQIAIALALYLSDRDQLAGIGQNQLINKLKEYQSNDKPIKLPQKLLDQLLFQINMNLQRNNKLQNQTKMLLDAAEKLSKSSQSRIYNYFRDEWQFFANQIPMIEKPPQITLRKTDILRDLGPSVSLQIQTLKVVISQIGQLNQQDIFETLMMMSQQKQKLDNGLDRFTTDLMYGSSINSGKKTIKSQEFKKLFTYDLTVKKNTISWNVDHFLLYCTQNIQNIKWQNVFANFDRQHLHFVSDQHFVQIMKIFDKIKKIAKKWTLSDSILFKKWSHPESQAQFLYHLFSCQQPDCIFFNQTQLKKSPHPIRQSPNSCSLRQIWGYLDLVSLLFEVYQYKKQPIRQLLIIPMTQYPDLLIRTLSQIKPSKSQNFVNQIYSKILPQFLQTDHKSIDIIQYLWESNKQLLIKTISQIHLNKDINMDKIVQIFQNIEGSLDEIIGYTDCLFILPLAFLSAKKQVINFQKWISLKLQKNQPKFCKQLYNYLENNLFKQLRLTLQSDQKQNILQQSNLNIQVLNKIFSILIQKLKKQYPSSKNYELFKKLHKQCCQLFPEVAQGHISQQAQKQSQQQIKKIYKQQISINDAIDHLKYLKNSLKKQQKQQFANRITFLCTQMTYHHSYPEKQLMITADLFSALINANMIQKKIFKVFLHVIDQQYLKIDNQKFIFALKVIQKIKPRLVHQTWFCQKLIDNELVMKKNPQLVQSIIRSIDPPKFLSIQKQYKILQAIRLKNLPPQPISTHIIIQPQIHRHHEILHKIQIIDFDILSTLDKNKKIQFNDRQLKLKCINTICNTLSLNNVQDKAKQLKKSLDSQKALQLLVYNIVFKRIAVTQSNGIQIIVKLIQNIPKIQKPVLKLTYKILQNWFSLSGKSINDKKFSNFKNIASWLGRMTIGKGFPVPIYKLNLKTILIKSYIDNNRLNFNISIILKILQLIHKYPTIFRQQSPWLRRIMRALVEIQANLKQDNQIKNQIRAFFKSTKMDIQSFLVSQPSFLATQSQFSLNQLMQALIVDQELLKLSQTLDIHNIKTLICTCLEKTIQQIMEPVIERTVKIAKIATKHLILKDFATQTNSVRVKQSSLNLIKQLSAHLSQITCKQPLKTNLTKNLKDNIKQFSQPNNKQQDIDKLIQLIVNQNLQFGCAIIKQKVVKQAQKSIKQDCQLSQTLQHRNDLKKSGSTYINQQYMKTIPSIVPKQLLPSTNGLTDEQYQIYNELKKPKKIIMITDDNIVELIQQKQSIQKIKIAIHNQHPLLQSQLLEKIYSGLLQENYNQSQQQYYVQICQIIKEVIPTAVCWKKFKQIADFTIRHTHRIVRKLVKQKYFQQTVITQLSEWKQKLTTLFENWISISQQQIDQYLQNLQNTLQHTSNNIRYFFHCSLQYILTKIYEQSSQSLTGQQHSFQHQCFDPYYIQQYLHLIVSFYQQSKQIQCNFYIQQILDVIIGELLCSPKKEVQQIFFKLLINLIETICSQKTKMPKQKITIFILLLSKSLYQINPLLKPSFAFSWLQILYNKHLIKYLLENYQHWDIYFNLLSFVLQFIKQNISQSRLYNQQYGSIYQVYYQEVLKLIIIILHDFSPFLSAFSLELCLLVDSRFIQLKNIINSAMPFKSKQILLKFERREDLENLVHKIGYPKYYNLTFDKQKLNYYLNFDLKDQTFQEKLNRQDDLFIQILVLYTGWIAQNSLPEPEATRKLTEIISSSSEQLRLKLINYCINLIQYPNSITLFFIDFSMHIIFKQKDNSLRELMLQNIIMRMKGDVFFTWGLIYLAEKFVSLKKDLENFNIPQQLLDQL